MDEAVEPTASDACWLILTPSVDHKGWLEAVDAAAREAGWRIVSEHEGCATDEGPQRLVILDDAQRARDFGARKIAAIVAEPESAPVAVTELNGILGQESGWHASTLLARALALFPDHRVVTAAELSARPRELVLFDVLRLTPPPSRAEFARDLATAAAFRLYRHVHAEQTDIIEWSPGLFNYCPRGARNSPSLGVLDTTGRPRMLVHGPYLSMPTGLWRASIRFGVDQDAAKHQFRLDWGTRTQTISEYVTPHSAGIYQLTLDFNWTDVDVAEIRLILMEGSFTGALLFQGVTVTRIVASEGSVRTAA